MKNYQLSPELMPVLQQLQLEGRDVYAYETDNYGGEINSLFWYENGRVLNIQPNTWRNQRYARNRFDIGASYIPSRQNGSGCGLSQEHNDTGTDAENLLSFRTSPTWVRGVINYRSMAEFIKKDYPLIFHKFNSDGSFEVTK